ncbi:hypothetical protein AB0O69_27930 [Streptomyces xiamenensis]|uniref:hypothetical protein n=1 Tax=Streptomyces xiamenensis TaxID=408015 RepID=UPI003419F921
MPGYEQLNNVDFRSLDAAIEDWRQTKGDLDALAAEAAQGLLSKIEASQWRGENATVSREFIIRAGSEFEYAHQQAQAVFTILTEFRAVQAAHQRSLQELAQLARQQGLYVQANGTVIEQPDGPYSDLGLEQSGPLLGPGTSSRQADIDHFAARIQAVLAEAATQDETTARALRENIGEDREHFAPVTAENVFDGERAQGIADAQEYLDLIESEAYNIQEGIDRLNELAAAQSHNEHFATCLATGLGAEGTLEFWADVLDGPESGEVSDAYRESVLQLRENLGVTFGTASQSHRDGMDAWRNDMIALGSERIGTGAAMNPYGFQIMSDLMMHGNYNKDWLVDYGAGLVNAEQEMAFDTAQFWANAAPVEESTRSGRTRKRTTALNPEEQTRSAKPYYSGATQSRLDRMKINRLVGAAVFLLTGSALLAGCSNDSKSYDYAIPDDLCGVHVNSTLSKSLLPPGGEYAMETDDSMEGRLLCSINIDSKRTAHFSIYMLETLSAPPGPAFSDWGELLETVDIEGEALLWERGAGVSFRCLADDESLYAYPKISIDFFDTPIDDDEERKDAIEAFARSYVEGVKEYQQCDCV